MDYDFNKIISKFDLEGEVLSCESYGEGHINQTYLAEVKKGEEVKRYIVQKINHKLFTNVPALMNNIKQVTEFNRQKILSRGGNPDRESLSLVYTKDGNTFYYDSESDGYFRIYKFIENAIAYQVVEKPEHFYQSAVAFGNFANLLAEFDASGLYEVIPDFHNTEKRFKDFCESVRLDKMGRAKTVEKEIEFVMQRKEYCGRIVSLLRSGQMPTKVTHNDTKLNNVMLDEKTGEPVAVIDLDTIMPGSICYDFGDSIRFGCNPAVEDEKDLSKVNLSLELFEAYAKGYLGALKNSVTKIEKDNLAFGAILMTYECGMRFLADYLDSDVYFRRKREGQNLDRARTQFKLVEDMEKLLPKMQEIINKY
ncbi:MAG: aminoglycoside phosphotransferase family protein [Clostridiales bacterium]|nr:aminoglycoside phosphotransferase family protein [Clostridiales bacterium]